MAYFSQLAALASKRHSELISGSHFHFALFRVKTPYLILSQFNYLFFCLMDDKNSAINTIC